MLLNKSNLASICIYAGFLTFFCFFSSYSFSQQNFLKGHVIDQEDKSVLSEAVVSVINSKDSILTKFTRSDAKGNFLMPLPEKGVYQLMVSYPGYADFIDRFIIQGDTSIETGDIKLIRKAALLDSVIVHQQLGGIRIKGDTIEYKVDSFLTHKGATVEELLKRLPGIQVDRNGTITAQGQKVNKVLVDGEEFFSDDPAVVIQNLSADYVKDVQVFDKKSDQAEFTGIDDGNSSRTINLKLKEDKKKGAFGKVSLGGGTDGKFQNNFLVSSFKGLRKFSAFGMMSNTDNFSLNWDDMKKLGAQENSEYNEDYGYVAISSGIDGEFNQDAYYDQGLPATWSGGLHYSDNFNDKQKFSADYRLMKRNIISESATTSRYILPDTQYFNSETQKSFSTRMKNGLYGSYDLKFDSLTSLKITAAASRTNTHGNSAYTSRALNSDSALVNKNSRTLNSDVVKDYASLNGLFRHKFLKKGRTISVNLSEEINNESLDGFLNSKTDYYSNGLMEKNELIDQKKNNQSHISNFSSKIVYTEPLSKIAFLSLNYGLNLTQNRIQRNTFDNDPSGGYKIRDSVYSNDFRYNYLVHSGGADVKINKKKMIYAFGGSLARSSYDQHDLVKDTLSNYSFVNFYPKASWIYKISSQKQLSVRYNGSTNQPTAGQLQPVRQNNNPLMIQIGNPGLRQEFRHYVSFNYYDFKVISGRNIFVFGSAGVTTNAISSSSKVDSVGKTTYQSINLGTNANQNISMAYGWKLKKTGIDIRTGFNFFNDRLNSMINGLMNVNNNSNYELSFGLYKSVENKFNTSLTFRPSYTVSKSSLRKDIITEYFTSETSADAWVQLPWNIYLSTNIIANTRQKTDVFDVNHNVIKWDAEAGIKFAKNKKAEISLSIKDILNQNLGFNRSATSNFVTENTYNTLRRYALLSFTYNLSKTE